MDSSRSALPMRLDHNRAPRLDRGCGSVARAWGLVALAVASATCAEPLQNGGVDVLAGAADRMGMLCRFRHGDPEGGSICPAQGEPAAPARVRRVAQGEAPLSGALAVGRPGDYVLENDEIVV